MEISKQDFRWEFCCYELMENSYMRGLNPNWGFCPFCGQKIEYLDVYEDTLAFDGDKDVVH